VPHARQLEQIPGALLPSQIGKQLAKNWFFGRGHDKVGVCGIRIRQQREFPNREAAERGFTKVKGRGAHEPARVSHAHDSQPAMLGKCFPPAAEPLVR